MIREREKNADITIEAHMQIKFSVFKLFSAVIASDEIKIRNATH